MIHKRNDKYLALGNVNKAIFVWLIFSGLSNQLFSQESVEKSVEITQWYGNKPGAVSLTFDDQDYSQYISAYPILEKYGLKGTFSVVGEWVGEEPLMTAEPGFFEIKRMGWPQLLELHEKGHEISAHGYTHQKYDKFLPVEELAPEMEKIRILLESRIRDRVYTLHYPYSYASENIPVAAGRAGYLFGRTGLDTINSPDPPDMMLLATQAVINGRMPDTALFSQWITKAHGNWLILMYHHFFAEGSKELALFEMHNVVNTYSILPEEFEQQVAALAASGFWIAPLCEVGKYIVQRENTEARMVGSKKKITVYTVTNLDKTIYDMPLTLEVHVSWKKARIAGSLNDGVIMVKDCRMIIDVMPESEVTITKE